MCDEPACGPIKHGDGVCCPGESACDEPACGPGYCGDGCCGAGEDACSCYADCASSVTCLTLRRGELGDIADTYLGDANPTYVGGARPIMYIGPTSPGKEYKPLLRFDLGLLPIGAHVFSATLHIPPVLTGSIIPQFGYVYPVLSPWDEATVTANNFGASSNFGASQQTFVLTAGHSTTMDLTGMVQLWVDGSKPNHGLMLRAPKGAVRALYSGDRAEPKERPRLDLCYATCEKK